MLLRRARNLRAPLKGKGQQTKDAFEPGQDGNYATNVRGGKKYKSKLVKNDIKRQQKKNCKYHHWSQPAIAGHFISINKTKS